MSKLLTPQSLQSLFVEFFLNRSPLESEIQTSDDEDSFTQFEEMKESIAHLVESSDEDDESEDGFKRTKKGEQVANKEKMLARRQKDIDYGVSTVGYQNWKKQTYPALPRIPNKYQNCSTRSWKGQIRKWRIFLHTFDNA